MTGSSKGRPPLVITDEQRELVRAGAARGDPVNVIAEATGVSIPTLRKHFAEELIPPAPPLLFQASEAPEQPARPGAAKRSRAGVGGRPPYQPRDDDRRKVSLLVATNMPISDIARAMDLTEPTLRKHFREELRTASLKVRARTLMAIDRAAQKGNVAAQKVLIDMLDNADLERVGGALRSMGAAAPAPAKVKAPETLGKKVLDAQAALDIAESPEWRDLLQPSLGEGKPTLPN